MSERGHGILFIDHLIMLNMCGMIKDYPRNLLIILLLINITPGFHNESNIHCVNESIELTTPMTTMESLPISSDLRWVWVLLPISFFLLLGIIWKVYKNFRTGQAIYMSQTEYRADVLASSMALSQQILRLYVHAETGERRDDPQLEIECSIPNDSQFRIHSTSHWIYVSREQPQPDAVTEHRLDVECKSNSASSRQALVTAEVLISVIPTSYAENRPVQCSQACRLYAPADVFVEEEVPSVTIAQLIPEISHPDCTRNLQLEASDERTSTDYTDWLSVNETTNEITLLRELDHESVTEVNVIVTCTAQQDGATIASSRNKTSLTLHVRDIDDNGPTKPDSVRSMGISIYRSQQQARFTQGQYMGRSLEVHDVDYAALNVYNVTTSGDNLRLFELRESRQRASTSRIKRITYDIYVARDQVITAAQYKFNVTFHDTSFIRTNRNSHQDVTMTYAVTIHLVQESRSTSNFWTPHYTATVSRQAAPYTEVIRVPESGVRFGKMDVLPPAAVYTIDERGKFASSFGITPKDGIIYVTDLRDTLKVLSAKEEDKDLFALTVEVSLDGRKYVKLFEFRVVGPPPSAEMPECDEGCSRISWESTCNASCGLGASSGRCQWRSGDKSEDVMTTNYRTCSHNLATCPNGECDELEQRVPWLCPQDCTFNVTGQYSVQGGDGEKSPARGIMMGFSTCVCSGGDYCTCGNVSSQPPPPAIAPAYVHDASPNQTGPVTPMIPDKHQMTSQKKQVGYGVSGCGLSCRIILFTLLACSLALGAALVVCRRRRKRKASIERIKHVNSTVSLNVLASDYVEDHDPGLNFNGVEWSPRYLGSKLPVDEKWEYPRENLVMEQTLGEGEFGRVVRAQALDIAGITGYSTVAVKMLKESAAVSELRDLWSEYTLLKDVGHRNVIRLLGASTQAGPFYVIVEYCEHGQLRSFLRECRQDESNQSYNGNHFEATSSGSNDPNSNEPPRLDQKQEGKTSSLQKSISPRDLLSFAWQISKGMEYLGNMKVVHRDLAARNVLVAADKVIKISDFGLSRDIYMEETYLKKSKGRIPVKWMAPESLYDHVYTTKSDVWSFGVVLWEIATLGATPYPGIAPERLYHVLKSGYRMERPSNCSEELFQVMARCWNGNANDRPNFKEIARMFETMLTRDVEYLDLTGLTDKICTCDEEAGDDCKCFEDKNKEKEEASYGKISRLSTDKNDYVQPVSQQGQHRAVPTHDICDSGYEVAMCAHDHPITTDAYTLAEDDVDEEDDDEDAEHVSVISSCRSHSIGATSSSSSGCGDDHLDPHCSLTKCAENAKLLDPNKYTASPTLNYIEVETDALSETGYGPDLYGQA